MRLYCGYGIYEVKDIYWKGKKTKYKIDNCGNVINTKTGKIMVPCETGTNGYQKINLNDSSIGLKNKKFYIHRLVAEYFIDNPENKPQVNHKDLNKDNNTVSNLEWATRSENMRHAVDNDSAGAVFGENNINSRFSDKQIHDVCKMLEDGYSYDAIAKATGVNKPMISMIKIGKVRTNISQLYDFSKRER